MRTILAALAACALVVPAHADDPLLSEALEFTGQIFFLDSKVPGLVIAGVKGNDSAVFGFGEVLKGSAKAPDARTKIGVGSITKSFTGMTLAGLVANGTVALTDPVGPHVDIVEALPTRDGRNIRFLDLATHASGLPRELEAVDGAQKYDDASFAGNLTASALLFPPGSGMLYSNVGFDLLAMAIAGATGEPYADVLQDTVLSPLGLTHTGYAQPQDENVMAGYDWNGDPMDPGDPIANRNGASGLYTTAEDMVAYLKWNLDRFGDESEMRTVSHAAYLIRDGLDPVYGLDESGEMDAMALGWVVMMPEGNRPLIIQKAGGTNGVFSYIAFAPHRDVGVFIAINQFNFSASMAMAGVVNELIGTLAPR